MRMTEQNWHRFPRKKTTIRLHALSPGEHKVLSGSYYHSKRLGRLLIGDVLDEGEIKRIKYLTDLDGVNDGFNNLLDLMAEGRRMHGKKWAPDTIVFIHPARILEDFTNGAP